MDILRAVLGDGKLNYVGASYGTFLGATYAGLYPARVGRMVLDGAMDPSLPARRLNEEQTAGFETAFQSFAKDCVRHARLPAGRRGHGPRRGGPEPEGVLPAARQARRSRRATRTAASSARRSRRPG